ncbi:hypothetical protein MOV08_04865 [Streptomyces yunnanensis]|uniref:Uncharacterized protein n=1 Tax=Streptomyces yunnanensis TaxID=156453 RepID=A0ABY8A172_9ACTN|nr:hypothetical protein [Streptomyces yunnanensis]WEB38695.1 hypothetical protein MOV08_04865 [Streptomyces yunnanensis]
MAATIAVMVLRGLPADAPKPITTGQQVAAGEKITLATDTPAPHYPSGSWTEHLTTEPSGSRKPCARCSTR